MPIFQASVINKYLKNLDSAKVDVAFAKFQENYNSSKIALIRSMKEEEYQDGFLRDLFVDVLGYTLKPDENFDLVREHKNQTDGKKADGAILKDEKAIAVIELKSTKTKDLKNITEQAFGYKNNQDGCKYVITSNFQKLRFYIDYTNEFEEFDLFDLTREDFDLLYLILSKDSVFSDLPLTLKKETKFHEEDISNKLYKDYSVFKNSLYRNLIKNNAEFDKLTLFKKSQKLLDRFLFILFAEDSGLLPPNSISRIIKRFTVLKNEDAYKPLYDIYKQYFGYMNVGRAGNNSEDNIPAYNGGLFYPDTILDNLIIDDDILIDDLIKLSAYDFNTEIDVNILGHIFEHSLSEIEEITAEIEGVIADKTKSKRKKDGVFYTPKYITQYIVENTVGTLCSEKRIELDIVEIEFDGSYRKKDGTLSEKGKKLYEKLDSYKEWLLTLKIVDPACGSGAFLNQALNFLIQEHEVIDDIIAELTNSPLRLFDTDKAILENNLYGVDINEESVEIAKLSLWLRTAHKDRKLSNLNDNIKCGNSLIDDPEVAGDKAFDWGEEFPEIMGSGGFDVVIGNPPYFNIESLGVNSDVAKGIQTKYPEIWQDKSDIIFYFIAKAIELSKNKIGYIVSNAFLFSSKAQKLRNYILNNSSIVKITNFEKYMVFNDASITTSIIEIDKNKKNVKTLAYAFTEKNHELNEILNVININENYFEVDLKIDNVFALVNKKISSINNKIDNSNPKLNSILKIGSGMQTGINKIFSFDSLPINIPKEFMKKRITGEIINKYSVSKENQYLLYVEESENFTDLPSSLQSYLLENKSLLANRADKKRRKTAKWWNYTFPMHKELYDLDKIWCSYRAKDNIFCYDDTGKYIGLTNTTVIFDTNEDIDLKYVLTLLNSKTLNFRYKTIGKQTGSGVYEYFENGVGKLPIPLITHAEQQPFIDKADLMLDLNKQLQVKKNKFISRIQSNFEIEKITKKLDSFYEFDFKTFVAEFKKQKIVLSLTQQDEWEDYFNNYKTSINELQAEISKTDAEIDQMVYGLYGLSEEEVGIVEGRG